MNKVWWAMFDTGSDHEIRCAIDCPGPEWIGPFRTFTMARSLLTRAGAVEAASLHRQNRWWRETPKDEILSLNGGDCEAG